MYVLTIVFLTSHVTLVSLHSTKEVCERLAERALSFNAGSQSVESAKCEPGGLEYEVQGGSMLRVEERASPARHAAASRSGR